MSNYKRISITIPEEILGKFKSFCEKNAINLSGRIAKLIEKDFKSNNPKL